MGRGGLAALVLLVLQAGDTQAQAFSPLPGVPLSMGTDASVPRAPLLTIERDVLYRDSAYGRRQQAELLEASRALSEENRRIEAELSAREQELTEQRADLPLEQFRALADAFDARVTRIRSEQDSKARALQRRREQEQQAFFAAALPVLAEIVVEAGAVAILERNTVFLASDEIDVTDVAIERLDATLGDGREIDSGARPERDDRPNRRPGAGSGTDGQE